MVANLMNRDAIVARENIVRSDAAWQGPHIDATAGIDIGYLHTRLSDDAVPTLICLRDRLPTDQRDRR